MYKEPIPKDLQILGLILAVSLTAIFVEQGGSIEGGFWLFLKSLPGCAVGLVIYRAMVKHEFHTPESWPEWIGYYLLGIMIGTPLVALVVFLFGKLFH